MAIMGFIIVVAGRVFSDSTGMRVRSQNMLASVEEAGRISALLKEDISQMGAKTWATSSASSYLVAEEVYQNATSDKSSFVLTQQKPGIYDKLTFKKILYKTDGTCLSVVEIEWYVDENKQMLYRKCNPVASQNCPIPQTRPSDCPVDAIEMASDVSEFRFFQSLPGAGSSSNTFPAFEGAYKLISRNNNSSVTGLTVVSPNAADNVITLSGFTRLDADHTKRTEAYLADASGNTSLSSCKQFTFEKDEEYSIYFEMPWQSTSTYHQMQNFQPGKDHLSIGLRNTNGTNVPNVPDFLFYPTQSEYAGKDIEKIQRYFNLSVPNRVSNACIAITIALYSEAAGGTLLFKNFKVKNNKKVYHFEPDNANSGTTPTNFQKAEVKAFQLAVGIKKKNEENRVVTVIPVPNNGIEGSI